MYYQIQIALDPEFKQIVVNKVVEDVTEYHVTDDLDYFTVYYWRVKSIDPLTGAESAWSKTCVFRVIAEDVTITTNVINSYIIFDTYNHRFMTSDEYECIIPDAIIGIGLCYPEVSATIGACYCPGAVVPVWEGYTIQYLLTEDNMMIETEDGIPLLLEY